MGVCVCVCAHAVDGIRGIIVRTVLLTVHAYICMYMCTMRRGGAHASDTHYSDKTESQLCARCSDMYIYPSAPVGARNH